MAHLAHGTSRADAKAVGEALEPGGAALVVIGISDDWSRLEATVTRAQRHVLQHQFGNWHEAEREAMAAILANKAPAS
jgi:gamma-glutamylcysteine synthetase